jgi:Tfp pilus assembly protein PilF
MARVQRSKPRDAVQFFAAALRADPNFAPALLNLATVSQQYLHDNKTAREYFEKYLAITPRPTNWSEVKAIADSIQEPVAVATTQTSAPPAMVTSVAPPQKPVSPPAVTQVEPKPAAKATNPTTRLAQSPRAIAERPTQPVTAVPAQVVRVAPEPQLVTTPVTETKTEHNANAATGMTTLPDATSAKKTAPVILPPSPVNFPRYEYLSPARPAAGDRKAANAAFMQAQDAERNQKTAEALQFYKQAATLDPSWFEAQYNAGVLAYRQQGIATALGSFERALAIQPDSVNARYLFALALKAGNYVPDADNELQKILADHPDEMRAHLALANLCAGPLRDPALARVHYRKVLELNPNVPQAADIRAWLASNPP